MLLTGGGPLKSTYFYGLYTYNNAFKHHKLGYASANAWVMFITPVHADEVSEPTTAATEVTTTETKPTTIEKKETTHHKKKTVKKDKKTKKKKGGRK
jgi:multiple sugar transport system permease protein